MSKSNRELYELRKEMLWIRAGIRITRGVLVRLEKHLDALSREDKRGILGRKDGRGDGD